jgi:hypothetical protein
MMDERGSEFELGKMNPISSSRQVSHLLSHIMSLNFHSRDVLELLSPIFW